MKILGVIGGLGPETTTEFYLDIVFTSYQKSKLARPGVIISSVPLPYKIEEELIMSNQGAERYIPYLVQEAQRLQTAGADFIVMPCNSLHVFINEIRQAVNVPVLSIVEETVEFLQSKNCNKVGIVSTSATIENKLYETAFEQAGIAYAIPNDFEQAKMGKYILNLVTGQQNNRDRDGLIEIIDSLAEQNVDCVALACTDLQLLIPKHPSVEIFDTMHIFANATVEYLLDESAPA